MTGQFHLPVWFDIGGVFLFSLTGAWVAIRKDYDFVGVFTVALITGAGGGLIRDSVFLQEGAPALLRDERYIYAVLTAVLLGAVTFTLGRRFERLIAAHPRTTFIGAHVGCAAEDLALVSRLLDEHANLNVDIAARLGELGRQPFTARALFLRHPDRILFGADLGPDPATYAIHYRFLETFDESFDYGTDPVPAQGRWQIHGVGLPDDVLRKVYRDNARRLFAMGPA